MKVRIEIDTKTFIRFWLVMFGFAAVIFAIYSASTALIIIGSALFLALALNGPVNAIARRLPGKSRTLATASAFILLVAFLGAVLFLAVPPIVQQTTKLIDSVPELVSNVARQSKNVGDLIERYHIQPQVDAAVQSFQDNSAKWAANFGQNLVSGASTLLSTLAAVFLTLVLTFLMLIEGPTWAKRLWMLYDDEQRLELHKRLIHRMQNVVASYVTGQMTVSSIGALASGLAVFVISLFIFEVPSSLALPAVAITFTLSLIPMFGATIGGALVAVLLAINSVPAAVAYIIFFIIYQQIENNFISPTIQSKRIELSPLAVLASVTIGLYVFGIAGGIISIPIAGCIRVLIEEYMAHQKRRRDKDNKPAAKLLKKIQGDQA